MHYNIAIIVAIIVTYRNLILKPRTYISGYDDPANYDQNPFLQGDLTDIVTDGNVLGVWEPVSLLFRRFVSQFIPLSASNVLIISLCLHIGNTLLIRGYAETVVRIYRPDATAQNVRLCSCFAALLFGLHPLRTEVVAWASCQSYLLAASFSIVFVQTYPSNVSVVFFLLAVLCKAVSISVPIVLVLLDTLKLFYLTTQAIRMYHSHFVTRTQQVHKDLNRKHSNLFRSLILSLKRYLRLFLVCILIACAVMRKTLKDDDDEDETFSVYDVAAKFTYAPSFYLLKSVVPTNLSLRYPIPDSLYRFLNWTDCVCISIFFAVSTVTIVTLLGGTATKTRERFSLIWLVLLGLLSPTSLTNHCAMIAADRYSYLPAAFLGVPLSACILITILHRFARCRVIVLLFSVLLCSMFSRITSHLVDSWEIEENLWHRLLSINPDGDAGLYMNLGAHYMESGRVEDASSLYETAIHDHNIESPELVKHFAASLALRGLTEDAASILREYENALSISGLSLLTSTLYMSQNFVESYNVFERHQDRLISSLRNSLDAIIMACDMLRRNHHLVEAELLCRRALSRDSQNSDTVLRAMSNLLLEQILRIEKNDRVLSWNRVDMKKNRRKNIFIQQRYVMASYITTSQHEFFIPKQGSRKDEAYKYILSEMNISRSKKDVRRMTQLCRDMLTLGIKKDTILSHLRKASAIGCRRKEFQDSSAVSRTGPEVTFSILEPYSHAECLSALGSIYADLKLLAKAAEYYDKSASSFEIENNDAYRSGAELYNAATMYGELTKWSEARVRFRKSLEIRPDLIMAHCYLGSISYMLREREQGLEDFEKCFETYEGGRDDQFWRMRDALKEGTFSLSVQMK